MSKYNELIKNGVVKLAPIQGERIITKKDIDESNKIKDFCLNCEKDFCNGECKDIIEFERRIRNEKTRNKIRRTNRRTT